MSIKEAIKLISIKLCDYLRINFTGKMVFTLDCKDGGIGRLSLEIKQDLTKKELTNS